MKSVFRVKAPGAWTTVQDRGRFSYQHMGVPICGALDSFAFTTANLLVENPVDAAVLEMTLAGPELEVLSEADIALTGAEMTPSLNHDSFPQWRSIRVRPGDTLSIGRAQRGCRAYLAVTGGLDVPMVMGSRSTYVKGGLGGVEGRPLRPGDILHRGAGHLIKRPLRLPWAPRYTEVVELRAIPGPQDEYFRSAQGLFFSGNFTVSPQADRMGVRLLGNPVERDADTPASIVSEPSMPGNVQIPPDGQPIILLVEQTLGGYAKIATVITPDMDKVAQARPGDSVRFHPVSLEEAHRIFSQWREFMAGIASHLSGNQNGKSRQVVNAGGF